LIDDACVKTQLKPKKEKNEIIKEIEKKDVDYHMKTVSR
jgi:hypothetical protein